MRLFPEFATCWGGAVISPAAETATDDRHTADHVVYSHRNRRLAKARSRGGTATHWKPKLNAISENSPVTDVNRVRPAGIANKKAVKVKPKSPAPSLDSWKSSEAMAVPTFSPMSFMF